MSARSKVLVCGQLLVGIVGSNPARGAWIPVACVNAVCCQVEISARGRSFFRRTPTECGVSEFDRRTSTVRRPRATRVCRAMKNKRGRAETSKVGYLQK